MSYLRDAWCCVCTTRLDKVKKGSIRRINPDNINEYSKTFPNSLILLNDCVCGDCKTNFYKIKTLQKQNENENKSNQTGSKETNNNSIQSPSNEKNNNSNQTTPKEKRNCDLNQTDSSQSKKSIQSFENDSNGFFETNDFHNNIVQEALEPDCNKKMNGSTGKSSFFKSKSPPICNKNFLFFYLTFFYGFNSRKTSFYTVFLSNLSHQRHRTVPH